MNPFVHALLAAAYIVGIVFVIQTITTNEAVQSTLYIPIAMLGLFTLSAAVMAFLFIYRPLTLYLDNERREALRFFATTLLTFAALVALYLVYLFFLVR